MAFVPAAHVPQGEYRHSIFRGPNGDMPLEDRKTVAEALRKALSGEFGLTKLSPEETNELRKTVTNNLGVNTALSLYGIPLQVPAKMLYTVVSPWRNKFPRSVTGGVNFSYRQITGINTKHVWGSVPEASASVTGRNTRISYNAEPLTTVTYKTLEMETILTREALFGGSSTITPGPSRSSAAPYRRTGPSPTGRTRSRWGPSATLSTAAPGPPSAVEGAAVDRTIGAASSTTSSRLPPPGCRAYQTSSREALRPCGLVRVVWTQPKDSGSADSTIIPAGPSSPSARPPGRLW